MGTSRSTSVVDPDERTWDHDNLYLVGCGNMPTLGTFNPTLTIAALAFRAAERILKDLNQTVDGARRLAGRPHRRGIRGRSGP